MNGERRWIPRYGLVLAVYVLATWLTNAAFMGDTDDYVDSAVAFVNGVDYRFWEFGHLFWRPLGWLLSRVWLPVTQLRVGADTRANVMLTFLIINWLAGLMGVLALFAMLRGVCQREWVVIVVTGAFIFSHGFLNYAQTGCSYVPGLSFLILGLYFLVRGGGQTARSTWRTAILAGAALAISVCLWFLYVWAIPAALLTSLFLFGFNKPQLRLVAQTTLVFSVLSGIAYLMVIAHLGISDLAELRAWIAPHGAPDIKGVPRMLFGFARSFINMGQDGQILKRYLIHDPFNPVSLAEIFRLSLWKFILFYLMLAAVFVNLLRSMKGRRVFGFFLAAAIPVIGFAIVFLGGDLERYFPLYPMLFLAVAYSLCDERSLGAVRILTLIFLAILTFTNVRALSTRALNHQQAKAAARVSELQPLLKPHSKIFTVNWQDELINFKRSFPFHPINRDHNLRLNSVVTPNSPWLPRWREDFATETLSIWQQGGDVWVSKRALEPRPSADWNWVEGDDKRISWTDIYHFFSKLEMSEPLSSADGFVLMTPSPANEQFLRGFIEEKQP